MPDHPADVVGDRDLGDAGARPTCPASDALDEDGAPHELVGDADDEQRIAAGALVDRPGQLVERARRGEAAGQVLADGRLVEPRQRDLAALPAHLQLVLDRVERMPSGQRLGGPARGEDQDPRRPGAPREVGEPVHRRGIAPVEILEPEDQGGVRGHDLDGLGQLAQHPLPGDAGGLSLERPQLRGVQDRRHLDEPRRRVLAEQAGDRRPAGLAAQAGHGFEQGR